MSKNKISLMSAILMNINIMAGAGIFVNIVLLTKALHLQAGLLHLTIGCFMFPLIYTFAELVKTYPSGGFYSFAQPMSPFLGFINCWTYFFGRLASVALYLHVISTFLQQLIPPLNAIHPLIISFSALAFYIYLNCLNVKIGIIIQKFFVIAKTTPLLLLIFLGVYHFDINIFHTYEMVPAFNFILMLPSALYCFSGFEAVCAISRNIENAEKNAPKAIFYSFFSIIFIYIIFQSLVSMMLMPNIYNLNNYAQAYPYLMSLIPTSPWIQAKLTTLISFLIGFSAMGAVYSILFSNAWNLYTLGQHNHIFASKHVTTLNSNGIPTLAVLTQGLIASIFLWTTGGNQIPLQQIATLGSTITYTISSIAFIYSGIKPFYLGYLALLTSFGLILACLLSILQHNITFLFIFMTMLTGGTLMYWTISKKS